jgi:hypothetical protein
MEPCIRRAVHGDVPVLARLNGVVHDLHVQAFPSYFKPTDGDELAARYQSLLSQPTTRIWLAEVDGRPVGYVLAQARAQRASDVELTTWCFNEEAQRAFEQMGFTPKSVRFWMNLKSDAEDAFDRTEALSGDKLTNLAREAIAEHRAGKTQELDSDRL